MTDLMDLNLSEKLKSAYELQEELGKGGFGVVYRAVQKIIDREVAIKIILPQYANQPEFIRRFQTEAKTVAKLDNRHIVPLYDFWRDPTGAYLVLRFLREGTLGDYIKEHGALSPPVAARMLLQIADALSAAHRSGVIHRDVKPANILLDGELNAYLSDFGIAKDTFGGQTEASQMGMAGSTPYMAPEQFQYSNVSPQSDIYSTTIMLYEMLTGEHPYADAPTAYAFMMKHIEDPLPTLNDFPKEINDILQKGAAKKPEERYNDIIEMAVDLREAVKTTGITQGRARSKFDYNMDTDSRLNEIRPEHVYNPYKGLQAFQENDAEHFFGRERLRNDILDKMAENHPLGRFISVIGPSGSGKSSVVKAGVIPELRKGELPGSDHWYYVEMLPGNNPMVELEDALMRVSSVPLDNLINRLMQSETSLHEIVKEIVPFDSELLLVIDQFEEAFTVGDESVRSHFLQNLYEAIIAEDSRIRVITTLRADFYDRPLSEARFGQLMEQRTIVVLPLTREELEEAIRRPAETVGIYYQEGLPAEIVNDVINQPGILPMLQYALTELFKRRDGIHLTREAYDAIGGVLGALARRADELYEELNEEEQEETRQLFLRLVTLGEGSEDTRRRAKQSEILEVASSMAVMQEVIDAFSSQRLVTTDIDQATREPTVEVAHEALIREWKLLRQWLDSARNDLRLQRLLARQAQEWEDSGHDEGFLLREGRLVQFEDWVGTTTVAIAPRDEGFVYASIEARERAIAEEEAREAAEREKEKQANRRLRALLAVALVIGVIAAIAAFAAFSLSVAASNARRDALANAEEAQSNLVTAEAAGTEAQQNLVAAETSGARAEAQANIASTQQAIAVTAQGQAEINAEQAEANAEEAQSNLVTAQAAGTEAAIDREAAIAAQGTADTAYVDAVAAEQVAIENEREARSLALSGASSDVLTRNSPLALLLAIRSNEILGEDNESAIALRALSQAVFASPRSRLVTENGEPVTAVIFIPNDDVAPPNAPNPIVESLEAASGTVDGKVYLWNVREESYELLGSHDGRVNAFAIHPDGSRLVSVGEDGQAMIWDIPNRQQVGNPFTVDATIPARAVAFNDTATFADGTTRIAVGYADGNIAVFSNSGQLNTVLPQVSANPVNSIEFRPRAENVESATASNDMAIAFDDAVRFWDQSANLFVPFDLGDIFARLDSVQTVTFRDNETVLTSESDFGNRPQLWNMDVDNRTVTDNNVQPSRLAYPEHLGQVTHVTYSPDREFLVSTAADGSVFLVDAEQGQLSRRLAAHSASVSQAAFSSDGRFILTGGTDGAMYLWDFNTTVGTEDIYNNGTAGDIITNTVSQVRFTEDELIFAGSERGEVGLWNWSPDPNEIDTDSIYGEPGRPLLNTQIPKVVYHLIENPDENTVFPDASTILVMGSENMQLYDVETSQRLAFYDHPEATAFVYDLAITRDGRWAVWAGGYFQRVEDREALVRDVRIPILQVWDTQAEIPQGPQAEIPEGAIRTFDVTTQQGRVNEDLEVGTVTPDANAGDDANSQLVNNTITAVAIHPDEDVMVTGDEFGVLTVWDLVTGEVLSTVEEHTDIITVLEFSADGTQLLSGSEDRIVILWSYNFDNTRLDLSTRFIGHTDLINDVDFNPIDNTIVTGSEDRRFILWDGNTGEILQILGEQRTAVTTVQFTPDGLAVVFGTLDGRVLYKSILDSKEIIEWARENRYIPCLNEAQATQYDISDEGDASAFLCGNNT